MVASLLILEPEAPSKNSVTSRVRQLGHRVLAIQDAAQTIREARTHHPDAIVFDEALDRRICHSVIKRLREEAETADIPVLAVSPSHRLGDMENYFRMGVDACVSTPYRGKLLDARIDALVRNGRPGVAEPEHVPPPLADAFQSMQETARLLGDVAEVYDGLATRERRFRRMASPGADWSPVIPREAVKPFSVDSQRIFVPLRKWALLRVPAGEEYNVPEKVLLQRTAPPVVAALDTSREPVASPLYSIVPVKGLAPGYLCCLLNSRLMDFYFNRIRSSGRTPGSGYIRRPDIDAIPVVIPSSSDQIDAADMARTLSALGPNSGMRERVRILFDMNQLIFRVCGFEKDAIQRLTDLHF